MAGMIARFFGRTASEGAAFAFGVASAPVLAPAVETLRQEAWSKYESRALDAAEAALLVAEGLWTADDGKAEASRHGVNSDRFAAMVEAAQTAPDAATLRVLWRRGAIDTAAFEHGLRKARLEDRWTGPLESLKTDRLDPAVIAVAIQRGIIADPGILPVAPPTGTGKVPAFPVFDIDAIGEAAAAGIDRERLSVMVGNVGLPASVQQAASAYFRGIIELDDYYRAVSEGNTRNEWRDAILEQARQILTATQYVDARLRGWIGDAAMYQGTAKHGMSRADTDLMFKTHGRPLSFRQVFIGLRRGGEYDGPVTDLDPAFLKALQQSSVRPEWYNLAWSQRYSYPSAFVLRALTQAGDITQADAHEILLFQGWEPTLAEKVARAWAAGGGTAGKTLTKAELQAEYEGSFITETEYRQALTDLGYSGDELQLEIELGNARRVKKFRDAVVTKVQKAYVVREIDDGQARTDLASVAVTGEAADNILKLWAIERDVTTRTLTPAQIAKAYKRALITRPDALTRLDNLGYSATDAQLLLDESA